MNIAEWKYRNRFGRRYAHFDNRVSLDDVWYYISNPYKVATHSFYPFIRYVQEFKKYSKSKGGTIRSGIYVIQHI